MIVKVTKAEQLPICLDIIHKGFQTVAEDLHLTRENCPGHTAFMPPEKLRAAFDGGCSLFLCRYQNTFAGCFSLHPTADGATLDHLAVYRLTDTWGSAKNWWLMPPIMQRTTWEHKKFKSAL